MQVRVFQFRSGLRRSDTETAVVDAATLGALSLVLADIVAVVAAAAAVVVVDVAVAVAVAFAPAIAVVVEIAAYSADEEGGDDDTRRLEKRLR